MHSHQLNMNRTPVSASMTLRDVDFSGGATDWIPVANHEYPPIFSPIMPPVTTDDIEYNPEVSDEDVKAIMDICEENIKCHK